jgi:DNA-directed RNA polymerase subunit beta
MGYPVPLDIGDKISNRQGAKGVIAQVLPDEEMPRLSDGSSVELIFPPTSIISRMNFGQIREAVMG